MEFKVSGVANLAMVSSDLLEFAGNERVFLFYGEMGAGKTTFIKCLCASLGVEDTVSSPTFSIVNEYSYDTGVVYHFDFYRLKDETEALDLGYEDYFYSGNYCFIEWPGKIPSLLPERYVKVVIEVESESRRLITASKQEVQF